jgi:hypothetical protein
MRHTSWVRVEGTHKVYPYNFKILLIAGNGGAVGRSNRR